MKDVVNPPAVHNFHDMVQFYMPRGGVYDLTSFTSGWIGDLLKFYNPKKIYPSVHLLIDGREYPAVDCRWYAYRALRRNQDCAGFSIESDLRMINEQPGILCQVVVSNTAAVPRAVTLSLQCIGSIQSDGRTALTPFVDHKSKLPNATSIVAATAPDGKPDAISSANGLVTWSWRVSIPPGGQATVGFVSGAGNATPANIVAEQVARWAGDFDTQFAGCKNAWEQRWTDAFTPGNHHFSGHLPTLITDNSALSRNYYMGVLTMLILERTQFAISPRTFITSGERAPGTQYYWDASMAASVWALLEPAGMKASLRNWLVQNPRSGYNAMANTTAGFDQNHYAKITGYAFNACTIFKTAYDYIRYSGDRDFLKEKLENGKTVLECMDAMATDWLTLPKGPEGSGVVNYGENRNLLECAGSYVNCVASLNAQDVWMMRCAADLHDAEGESARAAELRKVAAGLLPHVMALYVAPDGVWSAYHADGRKTQLRHCVDYIYVGNALHTDLSHAQKEQMNSFVKNELLTRNWMRAMSLKDPAAATSNRPDHGPNGAYDGWPALTVGTMWRLGDPADAFDFYCRTDSVTKEGPYAQAREFYGSNQKAYDAPVRVATYRGCLKECISGAAFADVVINTFFGYSPSIDGSRLLADPATPRPFTGTLRNVRYGKTSYTISADANGLHLIPNRPSLPVKSPNT